MAAAANNSFLGRILIGPWLVIGQQWRKLARLIFPTLFQQGFDPSGFVFFVLGDHRIDARQLIG